ncbi:prokaryotic molybdopterin-containing oxidoreductase family, iron-sulfur binding subunit [Algoriphagus alkaliphilus]|uniref:Prokaryotic molybdopterin-containing oxidoreductase family, iron-sulfur binding subunit n=1 Tax=Algoriphagus alkaliphilus TaxID=279824 RepID=A0A1G5WB28_9BACT|nr:TAT-variant-translocated molybdopterin oxidoreductase [Algoriphagus alkaliphilus]SDA55134.1 prokaryotic molybdopterin-containing oxidoreductase family, iron-sulfur binding subunit [Algoriphagus alkaliphilus]
MKENKKTYWKGLEQLSNDPEFVKHADKEFAELPTILNEDGSASRRDFLKVMGFSLAAASLAACEAPIRKAIPYVNKPIDINPSIPNYYASTFASGGDYAAVVVKTREGRPIKIDGNELSPINKGKVNAIVEASVLSLYDKQRLANPMIGGAVAEWAALDTEVKSKLASAGTVKIVANTILSPSTEKALQEFGAAFGGAELIMYDPISNFGISKAAETFYGAAVIPSYHFDKAKTIVSFGADFLGTWISPIEFAGAYAKTRKISKEKPEMSRHYQFESNLSMTGANADYRTPIKASQSGLAVLALYNAIASKSGAATVSASKVEIANLDKAAADLLASKGASLVVSGSNDPNVQIVINAINELLGNNGATVDFANPVFFRRGNDERMNQFVGELKGGQVGGVIFYNCNPVYDHARGAEIAEGIAKAKVSISTNGTLDETSSLVQIVAPDHHFLESWNDFQPKQGQFSLSQPTISPLFKTRQAQESFLIWAGSTTNYYDYLQANWNATLFPLAGKGASFQEFWDQALFNGVVSVETTPKSVSAIGDASAAASAVAQTYKADNSGAELVIYSKVGIGSGAFANNPWLQEMPDPITKATWDNYLTVSQKWATDNGVTMYEENTQKASITVNGKSLIVPILVQPGQANGTFGLAIGYGRTKAGRVADGVGVNAYDLLDASKGFVNFDITTGVEVAVTGDSYKIARTQTHQTFMGRENVIQESVLSAYQADASAGRYRPKIYKDGEFVKPSKLSLWKGHQYSQHHWGLAIDMNSCIGCGACTVACQVENNVAVVGKQEVLNRREMAWIRIDRYYSSDASAEDLKGMEIAAENPEVTFQPMMCQQCNNAPCETVCPVAATTHSSEGLNQMTYNRCIGTRYCANNCPYKVRRFNWFKYHDNKDFAGVNIAQNDDLGKMVLNPDVTVRVRGVMEKCSMCVQRIQAGKLTAKREKRTIQDGEINMACAVACPTDALVFGDMNDPNSKVSKLLKIEENISALKEVGEERAYHVLEEINVSPNVWYFTKIRNKEKNEA